MIILPDRNICRTKVLMPVPRREWMPPSHAQPKTAFGHENRVRFRLRSRLSDGHVTWQGWFDDRDDADAFLYAIAMGSLISQPDIWRFPTPMWHPDFGVDVTFEFAVTVSLTTIGTANTWTVPADWTSSDNQVHCIGGGASGGVSRWPNGLGPKDATGGGGGGYGKISNLSLTSGASVTYGVGSGGVFSRATTGSGLVGSSGLATYFNAASYAAATVGGQGGAAGGFASNVGSGLLGSAGGAGKGTVAFSGGASGLCNVSGFGSGGTGGGGAGGPNGNGTNSADVTAAGVTSSAGGSGDAGFGGAGGSSGGGLGSDGVEISNNLGSGGGGGGNSIASGSITAGNGGNYGAGGGGASGSTTVTSGSGAQGIVILVYYPKLFSFNLAMMGM